jgi:hypothetical protein
MTTITDRTNVKDKETISKTVVKNINKKPDKQYIGEKEKKIKATPRKKKQEKTVEAVVEQSEQSTNTVTNNSSTVELEDEPDMFLFIQNGQRYWTTDEHFQNGYLYGSQKNGDGDIVPNTQLVGRLVDGVANLF